MVGGHGPKRTMPLVARYADIWNCQHASVEVFQERSELLDGLLEKEGRQPSNVKRTIMLPAGCWRDDHEQNQRTQALRNTWAGLDEMSSDEIVAWMKNAWPDGLFGTPEQVVDKMNVYKSAEVQELVIQWALLDDFEGLQILAENVLPYFKTEAS
jgi:alkanesulfonate monooxygenase SsuD/methylene tetrahydromethanopterin reductase-like flavin-dependent oxidoreductase (luciferase family)